VGRRGGLQDLVERVTVVEEDLGAVLLTEARDRLRKGDHMPGRDHDDHLTEGDVTGDVVEHQPGRRHPVAQLDGLVDLQRGLLLFGVAAPVVGRRAPLVGEEDRDHVLLGHVVGRADRLRADVGVGQAQAGVGLLEDVPAVGHIEGDVAPRDRRRLTAAAGQHEHPAEDGGEEEAREAQRKAPVRATPTRLRAPTAVVGAPVRDLVHQQREPGGRVEEVLVVFGLDLVEVDLGARPRRADIDRFGRVRRERVVDLGGPLDLQGRLLLVDRFGRCTRTVNSSDGASPPRRRRRPRAPPPLHRGWR
jgi:hypothetical protein